MRDRTLELLPFATVPDRNVHLLIVEAAKASDSRTLDRRLVIEPHDVFVLLPVDLYVVIFRLALVRTLRGGAAWLQLAHVDGSQWDVVAYRQVSLVEVHRVSCFGDRVAINLHFDRTG